jgi:hypothetical protein
MRPRLKLRLVRAWDAKQRIGRRAATEEIRPSVPGAFADLVKKVRAVCDQPAATKTGALIRREQSSVQQKSEAASVAQSPVDES